MPEALTWQPTQHIQNCAQNTNVTKNLREHIQNSAQTTNVPNNQTEHFQNSAQNTNVSRSLPEHIQNSARGTNVPNNQRKDIQNSAQAPKVTNCQENLYQTVRETLEWQKGNTTHKKHWVTLERTKQLTEHIQNSAPSTTVTNNPTRHSKQCAKHWRTKKSYQTTIKDTYKKVCRELTWETIQQNTFKTVPKTLT